MKRKPKRSYETDLSDDDLILLDGLFKEDLQKEDLFKQNFMESTGLDYCHTLRDEMVIKTIDTFVMRKIVNLYRDLENNIYISMSGAGMKVWDDEHHPDWDMYCNHLVLERFDEDGNEEWFVTVYAPSLDLVDEFLDAAIESGLLIDVQHDYKKVQHFRNMIWGEWVEFPDFYHVTYPCGPIDEDEEAEVNWDLYEERRTWWGDPMELGGLPFDE